MKLIHIIIIILCSFTCFSQIRNGKIEYRANIEMLEGLKEGGAFKRQYSKAVENAKFLSFNLVFDGQSSVFTLNKGLAVGEVDIEIAAVASGYKGEIYQTKDLSLSEIDKAIGKYLLKNEVYKWNLLNETKEIEGFICYKATSEKTVVNSVGVFKFPVIAWYIIIWA
jgi:GLPGLI family protein